MNLVLYQYTVRLAQRVDRTKKMFTFQPWSRRHQESVNGEREAEEEEGTS